MEELTWSLFMTDLYTNMMLVARKVSVAVFAHVALLLSLNSLDKRIRNSNFSKWLASTSARDHGQYFSYRILGLAIMYGLIIAFV